MSRHKEIPERGVVTKEEKQVHLDKLRDGILGRMQKLALTPYSIAQRTGIDYMTIRRVLRAEGCQYWTAEVIKEMLTKLEAADAPEPDH